MVQKNSLKFVRVLCVPNALEKGVFLSSFLGTLHCGHDVLRQFPLVQILEAELRTQAIVLETLNTNLYQCQIELQREASPGYTENGLERKLGTVLFCPGAMSQGLWGRQLFKFIF